MKKNLIIAIAALAAAAGFASCSGGYSERSSYYGYSRPDVVVAKKANDTVITRRTIAIDTLYDSRVDDPSSPGAATVTTTTKEVLVYEPSLFTQYSTDRSYYIYQSDFYDPEVLVSVNTGYYSGFSYHPTVWVSVGSSYPWYNPWFSPWYDPWYNPWYRPHYGYAGYWGWGYYDDYYYRPYHNHHHYSGFYSEQPVRDYGYSRNYAQNASGVKRVQRPGTPSASTSGRVAPQNSSSSSRSSRVGQAANGTSQSVDKPVRTPRSSSITNGIKNVGAEVKPSRDAKSVTTAGATAGNPDNSTRVRKATSNPTSNTQNASANDKPIRIKKINPDKQSGTRNRDNSGVGSKQNGRSNREAKPSSGTNEQKRENKTDVKREPRQQEQPKREEQRREEPRQERRQESERPAPRMERSAPQSSPSPSSSPSRGSGSGSGSSNGGSRRR